MKFVANVPPFTDILRNELVSKTPTICCQVLCGIALFPVAFPADVVGPVEFVAWRRVDDVNNSFRCVPPFSPTETNAILVGQLGMVNQQAIVIGTAEIGEIALKCWLLALIKL